MNHIIRHSYAASRDGQTVEELLRSQGYSKSLINRVKLTDDGLMIRGEKVYTTRRMQAGDWLDVAPAGGSLLRAHRSHADAPLHSLRR